MEKTKSSLKNSSLKENRYSIWVHFLISVILLRGKKGQKEFYNEDKNKWINISKSNDIKTSINLPESIQSKKSVEKKQSRALKILL